MSPQYLKATTKKPNKKISNTNLKSNVNLNKKRTIPLLSQQMDEYDSAVKAPLTKSITDALATLRQTYAKNRETELFADEDPAMSSPLLGSPNATPTIVISDLTKENQP